MSAVLLRADGIRRSYGSELVLDGISLEIHEGEFLVILGPSGCGKTTLVNILAGFDRSATSDLLELDGKDIIGGSEQIAVIFQDENLFPWLTLHQNLQFGERMRRASSATRQRTLARYVREFGLVGLETKFPNELSGGQRQRAAVARALINHPRLLVADEPFRALDTQTRLLSQAFLWREIKSRRQTLCLITHDIDEALFLGDRLIVLSDRPTKVMGIFNVQIESPRIISRMLSDDFHYEKQRFVKYCAGLGLPFFPVEAEEVQANETES